MKATIYYPNKPARTLSDSELRRLHLPTGCVDCRTEQVGFLLDCREPDLLFADETRAVWGASNAADYSLPRTPDGTAAALLGEPLYGPILIVTAD